MDTLKTEHNRIGLIAGSGQFPILFSRKMKENGKKVFALAYKKETDPALSGFVEEIQWVHVGQVQQVLRFFRKHGITIAVMTGGIRKTRMFTDIKPDFKALMLLVKMTTTHDDGLLRAFADLMEEEGIRIESATAFLPELLAEKGIWTKRKPTKAEIKDIHLGWRISKEIGKLDIGQCIVAGGGSVLAVEAVEGTDKTIMRGGELGNGRAVVIKTIKPNQDTRFDVPAVGIQTIRTMIEANVKVLVIEAKGAVVFDKKEMISLADEAGVTIMVAEDEDFSV